MKSVQHYKDLSMSWKIISKPIDVAEVSVTDNQTIYLGYVRDGIIYTEVRLPTHP